MRRKEDHEFTKYFFDNKKQNFQYLLMKFLLILLI